MSNFHCYVMETNNMKDNSLWVNKPVYILQLTEINLPVYEDIHGEAIKYFEERRRWFCLKESSHAKFMKQV